MQAPVFSMAILFLAAVGDFVQEDEPLGEVETDKVRVMKHLLDVHVLYPHSAEYYHLQECIDYLWKDV